MPRPKTIPLPLIDLARCTGCGRCVGACPPRVLWLEAEGPNGMGRKHAVLHEQTGCTGCAKCERVCPFDAITMKTASPGLAGQRSDTATTRPSLKE